MHLYHCSWWTSWKLYHHNIKKLIKDDELVNLMNNLKLRAWTSFVDVVKNVSGNRWTENYKELVEKLLESLQNIDANISVMAHFLLCHLDKFPDNCGDVSD